MILSERALPPPERSPRWAPDALLCSRQELPPFLRSLWDEAAASPFGPWRVSPRTDPLDPPQHRRGAVPGVVEAPAQVLAGVEADQGTEAAADDPQTALSEAAVQGLQAEAYARGVQAGVIQARAAVEAERKRERELLRHLLIELRGLQEDPQRFFEPLRRLALHLAEQLVRAELQVSGRAVSQLVKQALAQLDHPGDKVVVSLHPEDLRRLQELEPADTQGLQLEPDTHLHPGSVRVRVNETVVQDLIEHRLEALARGVLSHPEAWLTHSTLLNPGSGAAGLQAAPPSAWRAHVQEAEVEDARVSREPGAPAPAGGGEHGKTPS